MRRLGATAVPLPLNEVMPSLQRGVIDGTMSGTAIFVAFKMNDVAKTITVTNDTMLVSLAVVSKVFLDKLPPDLRKIVLRCRLRTSRRWRSCSIPLATMSPRTSRRSTRCSSGCAPSRRKTNRAAYRRRAALGRPPSYFREWPT